MKEDTSQGPRASSGIWEGFEQFARLAVQEFLQELLEQEVEEFLGRRRSERRSGEAPQGGYRNGYGRPRRVATSFGTLTVQRPRTRGLDERFESRILPLYQRRTEEVGALLPELYLHGLAEGDFELALRGLLGEGAPLSASSIARLKEKWQGEYEEWQERSLSDVEVVYAWVDGIYVKAGLEKDKAAALVIMGALRDGSKAVLAIESGQRESSERWSAILRSLKKRGMGEPRLVMGDGHLGIWGGLANVYPGAQEQRCWKHRMGNVLDRVSKKEQEVAKALLRAIMYAPSRQAAEDGKAKFRQWSAKKGMGDAAQVLEEDWERMVTYYAFPKEHWKHLRTTNPVESPFSVVRLRTTPAKRYKRVDHATAVIWKTLLIAEKSFRKLDAPELVTEVADGAVYADGVRVRKVSEEAAGKVTA